MLTSNIYVIDRDKHIANSDTAFHVRGTPRL
jgi:hypothetical protein